MSGLQQEGTCTHPWLLGQEKGQPCSGRKVGCQPAGPGASGGWDWFRVGEGLLQLLPIGVQGEGPHQPAERRAVLHALQQLLQPLPRLAYALAALGQALGRQLRHGGGRGDNAVELAEAVPRLPELPPELGGEALEAGGQAAVGHMELLDKAADPGKSPGGWHLWAEGGR